MIFYIGTARLAQSAERKALNLVVVGSSPTVGALFGSEQRGLRQWSGPPAAAVICLPRRSSTGIEQAGRNPFIMSRFYASVPLQALTGNHI